MEAEVTAITEARPCKLSVFLGAIEAAGPRHTAAMRRYERI